MLDWINWFLEFVLHASIPFSCIKFHGPSALSVETPDEKLLARMSNSVAFLYWPRLGLLLGLFADRVAYCPNDSWRGATLTSLPLTNPPTLLILPESLRRLPCACLVVLAASGLPRCPRQRRDSGHGCFTARACSSPRARSRLRGGHRGGGSGRWLVAGRARAGQGLSPKARGELLPCAGPFCHHDSASMLESLSWCNLRSSIRISSELRMSCILYKFRNQSVLLGNS